MKPLFAILFAFCVAGATNAAEPLHVRIDRLIDAKAGGPLAGPAGDAEFVRRVHLDFTGRIPTAAETRTFLADKSPDKRGKLVDRLTKGAEYPRRMEELFHVILMERRGDHPEWRKFLRSSFEANKPWDRLVAEIVNPNANDTTTRGSAFFITQRLTKVGQQATDYPGLTRDIGRLFLGMDMQCAQCHDHLQVADYKQAMFQGMFAFVQNTFIRNDVKYPAVGEKPLTKRLDFMSVFIKEPKMIGPQVPGDTEILIPAFKQGDEYAKKPDRRKRFPGLPKFSPLQKLADRLPRGDNRQFTRNIVNRLWFVMLGRGLVHPLDLHHSGNAASHPKLLDLLAEDFVAHKFDVRYLLRELALTKAYLRSGLLPSQDARVPEQSYRIFNERAISAEQILRSVLVAVGDVRAKPQAVEGEFRKLEKPFLAAFANAPKNPEESFSPSVKAALFLRNSPAVLALLKPQPGNLVDRLSREAKVERLAEELYLAVLSRRPTADETRFVASHVSGSKDRAKAVGQLAWALLASTEFCLNH
jgi:hypothetical protein